MSELVVKGKDIEASQIILNAETRANSVAEADESLKRSALRLESSTLYLDTPSNSEVSYSHSKLDIDAPSSQAIDVVGDCVAVGHARPPTVSARTSPRSMMRSSSRYSSQLPTCAHRERIGARDRDSVTSSKEN